MPHDSGHDFDAVLDGVAPRLRALRTRRGLTLAELSEQTGISVSTLSRLESGGRRPTLDLLIRIAGVYRASLDDLVGAPQIADPRVAPRPFYRGGKAIIPLTRSNPDVHAFKMVLPGHPPDVPVEQRVHEGYDWIYVLSGRVRLALGGDEIVTAVKVPPPAGAGWRSTYLKFRERGSYDFALSAVALALRMEGDTIAAARLCLGGVAPIPWRCEGAEKLLVGRKIDAQTCALAGEEALRGAEPLEYNAYKVPLTQGLIAKALNALARG